MWAKFGAFFAAFGLLFGGIGGAFFYKDHQHARDGLVATGKVIDLRSDWDSDGGTTYAPVFAFADRDGVEHRVVSSVRSNPPSFDRGEEVSVIYDPQDPQDAVIDSFSQRYLFPLIFGGFGGIFTLIGGAMVGTHVRRRRMIARLKSRGVRIYADFQRCYLDTTVRINGRSPYKVVAQAKHPATGRLASFKSDGIWLDLTDELQDKQVPVLVDPSRPKQHWIDLSQWVDEGERV